MEKMESSEVPKSAGPSLEIREGEPKVHTIYAYVNEKSDSAMSDHIDSVLALYTDRQVAVHTAAMEDMFIDEDKSIVPLHVYEREEDLPDEIRERIQIGGSESLPVKVVETSEGGVYAVLPNTDSIEGGGFSYVMAMTTNAELAKLIARKNGPSGSNAKVVQVPLNRHPADEGVSDSLRHINLQKK